jgi:hypothetical protein
MHRGKFLSWSFGAYFIITGLCGNIAHSECAEIYLDNRLEKTNGRYPTFTEAFNLINERNVRTIVETGTARCGDTNFDGDGGSTILFGHWAFDHNAQMFSVDISESHIEIAKKVTQPYLSNLHYVLQDSVAFLESFEGPIDFLYLDSWDYSETDPHPAQIHNLKEVIAAYDKLHDKSIIMIDDCNIPGGGKGKLAIEYLLERGWHKHTNKHQVILLKHSDHTADVLARNCTVGKWKEAAQALAEKPNVPAARALILSCKNEFLAAQGGSEWCSQSPGNKALRDKANAALKVAGIEVEIDCP